MDTERWNKVEELFSQTLKLPASERAAFLRTHCDDSEILEEVESLLKHWDENFLVDRVESRRETQSDFAHPVNVGNYRILRVLGEGGMGVVYLAEQKKPIRRRVALKLIKLGMDTEAVISRFESERQLLALMEHENIARVFDAGVSEQGRPYFAMEYVDGQVITEYCDVNRLTTHARLELFRQVCTGVQHAHQKGVIHRDLKPSNVLVTTQDDKPVPKIIDFGVAKATEKRLAERTVLTELGQLIGTPEYMSPEQAGTTPLDVDTRTDIYSLGVLLYELLTGVLPIDLTKNITATPFEKLRMIREEEPKAPSQRVINLDSDSIKMAKLRRTDPRSLARRLRRDLDWITMMALEKNPSRRYGSASELAADITSFLQGKPVHAGRPSRVDRLMRFTRRHWLGLGFAALVFTLILVLMTWFQESRFERRAQHHATMLRDYQEVRGRLDRDELPTSLSDLRVLWEKDPTWRSWKDKFQDVALWAQTRQLWRTALDFYELTHENGENWSRRAQLSALLWRYEDAADAWRNASQKGVNATETAQLASHLSRRITLEFDNLRGDAASEPFMADLEGDKTRELVFMAIEGGKRRGVQAVNFNPDGTTRRRWWYVPSSISDESTISWVIPWDVDGDGADELVLQERAKKVSVDKSELVVIGLEANNGAQNKDDNKRDFEQIHRRKVGADMRSPTLSDVDQDGLQELVAPIFYYKRGPRIFDSPDGDGNWREMRLVDGDLESDEWQSAVADADNDGQTEVHIALGCFRGYGIEAFEAGVDGWEKIVDTQLGLVRGIAAEDLDRDGRVEIIASRSTTPYDEGIRDLKGVFKDPGELRAFHFEDSAYEPIWDRSLALAGADSSEIEIEGTFYSAATKPWLVVSERHKVRWDCCNPLQIDTLAWVRREGELLRTLALDRWAVVDIDQDGTSEIVQVALGPPLQLEILGLMSRSQSRAGAQYASDLDSIRSSVEPDPLRPGLVKDLNAAAEAYWRCWPSEGKKDCPTGQQIHEVTSRLKASDDVLNDLEERLQLLKVTTSKEWTAEDGLFRQEDGGALAKWDWMGASDVVGLDSISTSRPFQVELRLRFDRVDRGLFSYVGLYPSTSPSDGDPLFGLLLYRGQNCKPPGGEHTYVTLFAPKDCRVIHLRRPSIDFPVQRWMRLKIGYDSAMKHGRLLLHPDGSDPAETAIVDAYLPNCQIEDSELQLSVRRPPAGREFEDNIAELVLGQLWLGISEQELSDDCDRRFRIDRSASDSTDSGPPAR